MVSFGACSASSDSVVDSFGNPDVKTNDGSTNLVKVPVSFVNYSGASKVSLKLCIDKLIFWRLPKNPSDQTRFPFQLDPPKSVTIDGNANNVLVTELEFPAEEIGDLDVAGTTLQLRDVCGDGESASLTLAEGRVETQAALNLRFNGNLIAPREVRLDSSKLFLELSSGKQELSEEFLIDTLVKFIGILF